ncbi:ABC transporter substrate-binding protein [Sphaerisporangium aureirubrum]|uniref:ABC transporter substrate-binding protein n=1 Tax=Sphaerisporangium aureirubrum TaxID=1544736 RepID=A0ABW1NQK2_9ACTN
MKSIPPSPPFSEEVPRPGDPEESYRRSYEGVREFLRVFDQIRIRPTWRSGDVPVPVLWVTGPYTATAAVTQALEERCDGTPFAHLGPAPDPEAAAPPPVERSAPYADLMARLREASRDLASIAPRGEAHLRFPLLAQVLWLLDLQISDDEPDRLHDGVKRAVRQRRRQVRAGNPQDRRNFWANVRAYAEGPLPAWAAATAVLSATAADQLSTVLGICAIVAGPVFGALHVLLLSRSWAGRRRYKWFCHQPYLMPGQRRNQPTEFTRFAVRVIQARRRALTLPALEAGLGATPADPAARAVVPITGPDDGDSAEERKRQEALLAVQGIEHLLVNAFLHDLRQGYARSLWKFWRRVAWARTSYPVLLVSGGGTRLVTLIEEVRAGTRQPDPLLVVVTGSPARPALPPGRPSVGGVPVLAGRPERTEELWEQWRAELDRDRALGSHRLIRVDMEARDAPLLEKLNVPVRGRRRPLLAHPLLPLLTVVALLALSLVRVVSSATTNCAPSIWRAPTGECIGLGYGDFAYTPRLAKVLTAIDAANRTVVDSGKPYSTVVYFGKLTNQAGVEDALTDIHGELAGLAVRQRQLIQNSGDGSKLQMRVLVANAGADFRYAEDVARAVLRRVTEDPTIVGVVGLGESRQQVQNALRILSRKALPVVGTTATFDDLGSRAGGGFIPSYFPLAPPNSELAVTAARWARLGTPSQAIAPAKRAAVFTDLMITDLFGKDLGARFVKAFGDGATTVGYANAAELEQKVAEVCSAAERPDLAYYAGRSGQFGAFIEAIGKSQCHQLTVMANDDITQYVNDNAPQLGRNNRVRVVYVALAAPSAWTAVPSQFTPNFYTELESLVTSLDMKNLPRTDLPSDAYAVQAYDAAETLMRAAQSAYGGQGGSASVDGEPGVVDRGGVLLALENLGEVDGASGLIKLHGAPDTRHAVDRPILLVTVDPNGRQVVVRHCGRLYAQQPLSATCGT